MKSYRHEHSEDARDVFDREGILRHLTNAHGHEVHPTWPKPHMDTVHEIAHDLEEVAS